MRLLRVGWLRSEAFMTIATSNVKYQMYSDDFRSVEPRAKILVVPRKRAIPEGFPRIVVDELARRGMTQKDLAVLVGVDQSTISNHLSGNRGGTARRDSIATMQAIAKALDLPTDSIPVPEDDSGAEPAWKAEVERAIDAYPWPLGLSTADVANVCSDVRKEAFQHRGERIPAAHWNNQIKRGIQALKGKLVPSPQPVSDDDGPSAEMRAHKAATKKRRAS